MNDATKPTPDPPTAPDSTDLWAKIESPLCWDEQRGMVLMLDQRRLPGEERWLSYDTDGGVASAIRDMVVRGAPAIGCAAAFGLAAGALRYPDDEAGFLAAFERGASLLGMSRPTAVNLHWAVARQRAVLSRTIGEGVSAARAALVAEAQTIYRDDIASCRAMGRHGAALIPDGARILTHCNAGALATAGYGTALGVIRAAAEAGKRISVFVDETRPYLQGARLTTWELARSGLDVTLICDNMAGALMKAGEITHCVVGADRIARNGDTANKIGTYMVAVLAARHNLPFYVAAPRSTFDRELRCGDEIPIEQRSAEEVTRVGQMVIAPEGIGVRHIAFDVTPASLIGAIITESGIAQPPSESTIARLFP